jgi:hypothetical protein
VQKPGKSSNWEVEPDVFRIQSVTANLPLSGKIMRFILATLALAIACGKLPADPPQDDSQDNVLFSDDFEQPSKRWQFLDPDTWQMKQHQGNKTIEIIARASDYKPPVRSPGHVALIRDLELGSFEMKFRVRSTKDTGNHRDCCIFFGYQDDQHFYYAHLGAKPDPHSGQIMIVNEAPRKAITDNKRLTPWDDQWHWVKLTRDLTTGTIKVYFDDMETPHLQVTDQTFGKGRVGIGSFDDLNEFDDLVVSSL